MNMTRKGKVARLPRAIREELNERLADGETAKSLVGWLNALPEVQAVVAAEFGGRAIREQNVSEWKQGGYEDWRVRQEAAELIGDGEVEMGDRSALTEALVFWVTARMAAATREVGRLKGKERWRVLGEICDRVVKLRRGDQQAQRLQFEREKLEVERSRR
ncbi:MAG TPA: hypothetical protein VK961_20375, partial [Chthoniobacter sp.]|nr:hypothetical protein [Chthoniobacter sp.]